MRQGIGVFEDNARVMGSLPKNNVTEQRVTFKNVSAGHGQKPQPFVDIREHWFKDGPAEEPIPTSKGIMVKEDQVPKLIEFLLLGLGDGSIDKELAAKLARFCEAKASK